MTPNLQAYDVQTTRRMRDISASRCKTRGGACLLSSGERPHHVDFPASCEAHFDRHAHVVTDGSRGSCAVPQRSEVTPGNGRTASKNG
eukprot:2504586-Rhodomonas_salina.1